LFMNCIVFVHAQLKPKPKCDDFKVDILDGTVNGMRPDYTMGQIKEKLPCFTSSDPEGTAKCGGTIFFKDRDVYFYTERDYVEIKDKFKGRLSMPLFTTTRKGLFKYFGNPVMKDTDWDAFTTAYGIAVIYFNKAGKVNRILL